MTKERCHTTRDPDRVFDERDKYIRDSTDGAKDLIAVMEKHAIRRLWFRRILKKTQAG